MKPFKLVEPPELVTLTLPEAPYPTVAVISESLTTVNDAAATPPKLTAVVPVKLLPEMLTVVPVDAVAGLNEVREGGQAETIFAMKLPNDLVPLPIAKDCVTAFVAVLIIDTLPVELLVT